MKGYQAIEAMERGECASYPESGNVVHRIVNRGQIQYFDPGSKTWKYTPMTTPELFRDDWQIVPDPSKPQERSCERCGELITGNVFNKLGWLVCATCYARLWPEQKEPEPFTAENLPWAFHYAPSSYRDLAAAILNECRQIAREEIKRGKGK